MITINTEQLASNVKAVTAASDESWGNTFRSAVNVVAIAIAFVMTIGLVAKAAYNHPVASFKEWTKPPTPETSAVTAPAPVKEKPKTRPTSKPRPAAVSVIAEKPATANTPKRAPRARKKRTLVTA